MAWLLERRARCNNLPSMPLVSLEAVLSLVTQRSLWEGSWRDGTYNGAAASEIIDGLYITCVASCLASITQFFLNSFPFILLFRLHKDTLSVLRKSLRRKTPEKRQDGERKNITTLYRFRHEVTTSDLANWRTSNCERAAHFWNWSDWKIILWESILCAVFVWTCPFAVFDILDSIMSLILDCF